MNQSYCFFTGFQSIELFPVKIIFRDQNKGRSESARSGKYGRCRVVEPSPVKMYQFLGGLQRDIRFDVVLMKDIKGG